jgi:serine/threonine-protein kinase RsbW
MKNLESSITLPSVELFVPPALAFIRSAAVGCGFSGTRLNNIETAAEEALTNVIKHAYEGHSDETFQLSVCVTDTDFIINIREKGMPFSPGGVHEYDPARLAEDQNTEGLGLFMMKKMMDDIVFENLGRDGKSLKMVIHLNEGDIKRLMDIRENKVMVENRPGAAEAGNICCEVRAFRPEDALEISRCAYKAYGYTYEPYIYYPEKIIEMNQNGLLRSFVAAGRDGGEIMGHIAFKYKNPDDRVPEIGVAFVKPEYRKSGVYKSMMEFCHKKAVELNLFGLFGRAVTSHIGSQKILEPMGYVACGIFFGLFPDDVDFKAITGKIKQKESGLLFYRPNMADGERTIYSPAKYLDKIRGIFASFNIAVNFGECAGVPAPGSDEASEIKADIVPVLNIAEVEIGRIGAGVAHELRSAVHELCLKRVDAIFVHIDIQDPKASIIAEECGRLGFFFSGVLPFGLQNRHELILQYMNNLKIDYDAIKPYSASALEILNYARSFDTN